MRAARHARLQGFHVRLDVLKSGAGGVSSSRSILSPVPDTQNHDPRLLDLVVHEVSRRSHVNRKATCLAIIQNPTGVRSSQNPSFSAGDLGHENLGRSNAVRKQPLMMALHIPIRLGRICDDHGASRRRFIRSCRSPAGVPTGFARQAATRRASSSSDPTVPDSSGIAGQSDPANRISICSANASCSSTGSARTRSRMASSFVMAPTYHGAPRAPTPSAIPPSCGRARPGVARP